MRPTRILAPAAALAVAVALAGCAPPGTAALPFTGVSWPTSDMPMSTEGRLQIERLLVRLGYLSGGADGQITADTRAAIRTYQRDIGAPVTGFISQQLLDSLAVNAGQATAAPAVPAAAPAPAPAQPAAPVTTPVATPRPTSDRGGGGGDDGGSIWN